MLIMIGATLSVIGLIGIIYSIVAVAKAKRAKLEDAVLRERLAKVLPINLGALLVSVIGLMCVIVGIVLA
ncbi:MAG: hypothetical protein MUR46_07350 [Loktanella sp.]|mgnify:FL=1|jgi:hypothetical protein|nr:hypothetical protein [Yoonia sp.]MDO7557614.1 hypothetical protein [Loktanella sp.]MDO7608521.1 hypothetical protein [Loktanella sp.]MDO7623283.1 hypothetical protein [Loktanella sp.]MDO7626438.1 hypothetical protein [Loktanella sp.]